MPTTLILFVLIAGLVSAPVRADVVTIDFEGGCAALELDGSVPAPGAMHDVDAVAAADVRPWLVPDVDRSPPVRRAAPPGGEPAGNREPARSRSTTLLGVGTALVALGAFRRRPGR